MEAAWWPAIADSLTASGAPWPEAAVLMDLRWWDDHSRMNRRDMRPGRPTLCRRWCWTERAARAIMADRDGWADPAKPDLRPANVQPMSSERPANVQPMSSFLGENGAVMGGAGQPMSSERPADVQPVSSECPHARNTQSTDTDTATGTNEQVSATPPAAGAAQLSLLGEAEKVKPEKAARAEQARHLLARLEALRLSRHRGRGLTERVWLPKLTSALAKRTAQSIVDGYLWALRSPAAAFLRGEDGRGTTDYTTDYSTVLAHPEYADRRRWRGPEAPLADELADARAAAAAGKPMPEWVERWRAADRLACDSFTRSLEAAGEVVDDIW